MDQFNGLSNREQEVVKLLLESKSNKQIALALHITDNTVEFHLKNIYSKYQVSSRAELIIRRGNSVVASMEENAENGDRQNSSNWSTPLSKAFSRISKEFNLEYLSYSNSHNGANPLTFYESILV